MMVPARLVRILRTCETDESSRFPPTEVFNEGWMLRLLLDAVETLGIRDHPLFVAPGSGWFSEALLTSPFRPKARGDALGEGFTNADAVIGDFEFRATTKAGLRLNPRCRQFVVIEAKMFSNLSTGTKNAPSYNQAARNVACMAETIAAAGCVLADIQFLGFFVIAPAPSDRGRVNSNLENNVRAETIRQAVDERIGAYQSAGRRADFDALRSWRDRYFLPTLDRIEKTRGLGVLSWDSAIDRVYEAEPEIGNELRSFYKRCLAYRPQAAVSF